MKYFKAQRPEPDGSDLHHLRWFLTWALQLNKQRQFAYYIFECVEISLFIESSILIKDAEIWSKSTMIFLTHY